MITGIPKALILHPIEKLKLIKNFHHSKNFADFRQVKENLER